MDFFIGGKAADAEVIHWPPNSAEVKNVWSYNFSPPKKISWHGETNLLRFQIYNYDEMQVSTNFP